MTDYTHWDDTTSTVTASEYEEWEVQEFMEFVRGASTKADAVANIKVILKEYKKRISAWELIKLLLRK